MPSASSAIWWCQSRSTSAAAARCSESLAINRRVAPGLFAVQHSVMAREGFRARVDPGSSAEAGRAQHLRVVRQPRAALLLFWQWRPITHAGVDGDRTGPARRSCTSCSGSAGCCALTSTFMINHFELFGLNQVSGASVGPRLPAPRFQTPLFYRLVRHPLYLGFLLASGRRLPCPWGICCSPR